MLFYHRRETIAIAKETKAHVEWVKANTTHIGLKLNNRTDADIIHKLSQVDSKQGYIKEAIRAYMSQEKK